MATSTINIRVDEELKKNANLLFNKLGLNMSTAINKFCVHNTLNIDKWRL